MANRMTQRDLILGYLIRHGSITPLKADAEFGVKRLASRIDELRDRYNIDTIYCKSDSGKRYAEYVID